jgi:hypothetical protein
MAANITPYAKKYGVKHDGKSGLTPVEIMFPIPGISPGHPQSKHDCETLEEFQRQLLRGYTTSELMNLDAISTRSLKPGNLTNDIHPLLRSWEDTISRWFRRDKLYPIGHGFHGDWIADNPVVWKILEPVLKLASRILMHVHKTPWVSYSYPSLE